MGELKVILIVLIITAIVMQSLLYKIKDNAKYGNLIYWSNILLVLILSFIVYTSQADNFVGQKILAISWGVLGALSIIVRLKGKESLMMSKVILTIAIVGSFVQFFM